jgi:hypothetical protein
LIFVTALRCASVQDANGNVQPPLEEFSPASFRRKSFLTCAEELGSNPAALFEEGHGNVAG